MKELPIPERVPDDAEEFARLIRLPDGRTVVLLSVAGGEDPFVWGLHAVDLMHHAARVLDDTFDIHRENDDGTEEKVSREEILQRIREGFDAEWSNRTGEARAFSDA